MKFEYMYELNSVGVAAKGRGCPAGCESMAHLRLISGDRVAAMRSSCAGRQLLASDLHNRDRLPVVQISSWGLPTSTARVHSARSAEELTELSGLGPTYSDD